MALSKFALANQIIKGVSSYYGVSEKVLKGPLRTKTVVEVRWVAMQQIHEETTLSLTEIGGLFNRDHATVCHALKQLEKEDEPEN